MALAERIVSLRKQHAFVDRRLREEESHPALNDVLVHQLKCQKLSLKDEIARLSEQMSDTERVAA